MTLPLMIFAAWRCRVNRLKADAYALAYVCNPLGSRNLSNAAKYAKLAKKWETRMYRWSL